MKTLNFIIEYWAQISVLIAALGWSISKLLEPLFEINKIKRAHKRELKIKLVSDIWDFNSYCLNLLNEVQKSDYNKEAYDKVTISIYSRRNYIETDIYKVASIYETKQCNIDKIIKSYKSALNNILNPVAECIKSEKLPENFNATIDATYKELVTITKDIYNDFK